VRVSIILALTLLACSCAPGVEQPRHTLLPTTALARRIRALQNPDGHDTHALKTRLANIRRDVGSFVVRQIDAYPAISNCDLQKQLDAAFAFEYEGCGGRDDRNSGEPRVFAVPWGPRTSPRVFVIEYGVWFGFYGGGSETVLESYVWDRDGGAHAGAGLVPAAFSGLLTQADEVGWFADSDSCWVLISGSVGGGSGRVIGGSAAVFEVSAEAVKAVWNAPPRIGNVVAYAHPFSSRWELEYADVKRFYAELPNASLPDIYQVDYARHSYTRLVHIPQ
jgi:hypothetical protein